MKILVWLQKNLVITIPVVMLLGFITGITQDVSPLKELIMPLTFLMVYPMMVNMQINKILKPGDGKLQLVTQLINFLITPFAAFAVGLIFFKDNQYLVLGLLLTGLLPTSGMTISWTGLAKGNMIAAVKMTIFGLLLGSVLAPLYIKILMGTEISINLLSIFRQILIIVVVPLILGNITQRLLLRQFGESRYQEDIKRSFPPFSTLGVLGIVFVAMALKAKGISANPLILVKIILPIIVLYGVNFLISISVGKTFFNREDGIALLYGTVMRNLSIALAIAMTSFGNQGSDIALVIAIGYIVQVQLAAWFVKFTDRVYGPAEEPVRS